jgi:penicillin-binding protein 1A
MWIEFMRNALHNTPDQPINQPPGIVSARINPITGKRATATDPNAIFEYFMQPYIPEKETTMALPTDDVSGGGSNSDNEGDDQSSESIY